jgi:hypothetical protein
MPREARVTRPFVVLEDGSIHFNALVVRRQDSIVMADGGELPDLEGLLVGTHAPGRCRVKLPAGAAVRSVAQQATQPEVLPDGAAVQAETPAKAPTPAKKRTK